MESRRCLQRRSPTWFILHKFGEASSVLINPLPDFAQGVPSMSSKRDRSYADRMICKPFLLTGYCGYGDACLYIHTRDPRTSGDPGDRFLCGNQCSACGEAPGELLSAACRHLFCVRCAVEQTRCGGECCVCGCHTYGRFLPHR